MRKASAVLGLIVLAMLTAFAAHEVATRGVTGEPYRFAACPQCGRSAVFDGPNRRTHPADWAWFDCDHCRLRFVRYDDGQTRTLPRN